MTFHYITFAIIIFTAFFEDDEEESGYTYTQFAGLDPKET